MRTNRIIFYSKAAALLAFAMAAGAGCCYRIMAEPAPYIIPVETVPYEVETLLSKTEPLEHENDMLPAELLTDNEESEVAPEQLLYDIPLSAEHQQDIRELAERYEVSYELVLAVIMTESSGKTDAVGDGGASVGLMQIQPKWYGELITESGLSVDKPIENVELGIRILLGFIEENDGSLDKALKQYNSGNPDYEGNEYIERVYEWLDYFQGEAAG